MYSEADLESEVRAIVEAKIERGETAVKSWVMHEVLSAHPRPDDANRDFDFWDVCAWNHTGDVVRRVLHRYKVTEDHDKSITLPGFEYLQRAYLVDREGEPVAVPVQKLSRPEIVAKASEYRKMGMGCFAHADELMRYADERDAGGGAAA